VRERQAPRLLQDYHQGLDLLEELDEPVNRWDVQAVSVLPPSELDSLIALLDRVRASNY
jgi:hypothetical protein